MRILFLGGSGFIGGAAARRLIADGHEVAIFSRGAREVPTGARVITGDWGKPATRERLGEYRDDFATFAPDVAIDMLMNGEIDARAVVDTLSGVAPRLVSISSGDVYRVYAMINGIEPREPSPPVIDEEGPLRRVRYPYRSRAEGEDDPLYYYDKILGEEIVMGTDAPVGTILRLPAVYGPGDPQHRMIQALRRMADGRPAILLEEALAAWRWSHGYVEDIGAAIALAATDPRAAGRIYNVGEATTPTTRERVERLGRAFGWSGQVIVAAEEALPDHLRSGITWSPDLAFSTDRIRAELGFSEPTDELEGLRRTASWLASLDEPVGPSSEEYAAEDRAIAALGGD